MGTIKNYLLDLAYRTADAVKNDITEDLHEWYFGEDFTEYFIERYSDGRTEEIYEALLSAEGDMPWTENQPHVDAILSEIEYWNPRCKVIGIENEWTPSQLGQEMFKETVCAELIENKRCRTRDKMNKAIDVALKTTGF